MKTWLERVEKALLDEGFKPTPFQRIKPGQFFGLVKDMGGAWQMHVRGFRDGRLEPEIEISRFYLEHPRTSRPAAKELRAILDKHRIPYRRETKLAAPIRGRAETPPTLTDWRRALIHPRLWKGVGICSLCMGILALVLCAYFWGAIESARLPFVLFLVLAGFLLLGIGVWFFHFTTIVERALKRG